MGAFATPWWGQVLAWLTAAIIVALNGKLVLDQIGEWVALAAESEVRIGPVPVCAGWWPRCCTAVAAAVARAAGLGDAQALVRPSPAWTPKPSVALDWADSTAGPVRCRRSAWPWSTTRPTPRSSTGPSAWRSPGSGLLVLLHVVDTPMTRVHGAETADRETGADARYLAELVRVLGGAGTGRASVLLYGPDPAGAAVGTCSAIRSTCWSSARTATAWSATSSRPDRGQGPPRPGDPDAHRPPRSPRGPGRPCRRPPRPGPRAGAPISPPRRGTAAARARPVEAEGRRPLTR